MTAGGRGGTGTCRAQSCVSENVPPFPTLLGRAGRVAQVVDHLPTKYEVLSLNPNITKTKQHSLEKGTLAWDLVSGEGQG
jgi:hypothetical protein